MSQAAHYPSKQDSLSVEQPWWRSGNIEVNIHAIYSVDEFLAPRACNYNKDRMWMLLSPFDMLKICCFAYLYPQTLTGGASDAGEEPETDPGEALALF